MIDRDNAGRFAKGRKQAFSNDQLKEFGKKGGRCNKGKKRKLSKDHLKKLRIMAVENLLKINSSREIYEPKRLEAVKSSTKIKSAARKTLKECREQILQTRSTNPGFMKCQENYCAVEWWLSSPDGNSYHFKNLMEFIRSNEHLFSSESVKWVQRSCVGKHGKVGECCLAYNGLRSLKPYNRFGKKTNSRASWRGWIWIGPPNSGLHGRKPAQGGSNEE